MSEGQVLGERYRVESRLGRGGMGQVFRVTDLRSGQPLALKVLRPVEGDDAERVRRFQREIPTTPSPARSAATSAHVRDPLPGAMSS